jgi:hypothetical protein
MHVGVARQGFGVEVMCCWSMRWFSLVLAGLQLWGALGTEGPATHSPNWHSNRGCRRAEGAATAIGAALQCTRVSRWHLQCQSCSKQFGSAPIWLHHVVLMLHCGVLG